VKKHSTTDRRTAEIQEPPRIYRPERTNTSHAPSNNRKYLYLPSYEHSTQGTPATVSATRWAGLGWAGSEQHLWYLSTRFCRQVRASTVWTSHNVVTVRPPYINTGRSYCLQHPPKNYSLTQAIDKLSLSKLHTTRTVRFRATRVSPEFPLLYSIHPAVWLLALCINRRVASPSDWAPPARRCRSSHTAIPLRRV